MNVVNKIVEVLERVKCKLKRCGNEKKNTFLVLISILFEEDKFLLDGLDSMRQITKS